MQLTKLEIRRADKWDDNKGQLVGLIEFTNAYGKQAITLSPKAILNLLSSCEKEVVAQAKANAAAVPQGFDDALAEQALAVSDEGRTLLAE